MDHDEFIRKEEQRSRLTAELAIQKVRDLHLPAEVVPAPNVPGLGYKAESLYQKLLSKLLEKHGPSLPKVISVALHDYWLECWRCASYVQSCIDDKSMNNNSFTRTMATGAGYADSEGWAYTLYNAFADLVPKEGRKQGVKQLTGHEILNATDALTCMAVYWLNAASSEMTHGHVESACDLMHEAYDAITLEQGLSMWDEAWNMAIEHDREDLASKVRSDLARKAGLAAHAESHALKAEVREFWKNNISPLMSNDDAASILMRQFPLTFRTLSRYVSGFKNTVD